MQFDEPERREHAESIVPMINVVFLLLIFFLMTATIAPPEPFEVTPPESSAEAPSVTERPLFVSADGQKAWGAHEGEEAVSAMLSARRGIEDAPPLVIRADRDVEGAEIARLLKTLAAAGITESQLVAEQVP